MSPRAARRLTWGLIALAFALFVAGAVASTAAGLSYWTVSEGFLWAIALVFGGVGGLIATRQPGNAIGWIFLSVAVSAGLSEIAHGYADYWVSGNGGSTALGEAAAVYGSVSWIPFILLPATFLLLLFPNGRLLSPRWRRVAWCAALGMVGAFVTQVLTPGRVEDYPQLANPYGVDKSIIEPLTGLSMLVLLIGLVGSAVSIVLRFRRARGEERLQIKWLALAGAVAVMTIPVGIAGWDLWGEAVSNAMIMLSVIALPVAAGVAILRYRLYDIDVVINRTLVYGALTATLAAVYLGSVLLLQLALSGLTAGSGLAVAASTLAVAGVVRPARTRIQELVDRRFYRRRYDAQRTLERFSTQLRDEVDLVALEAELRGVVAETMEPAHVSVWLRPTPESR